MTQWITLGLVVLAQIIGLAVLWTKQGARLKALEDEVALMKTHHVRHDAHAADMALHELDRERIALRLSHSNDIREISREISAHSGADDVRFGRIDQKLDVLMTDIRNILQSLASVSASLASVAAATATRQKET